MLTELGVDVVLQVTGQPATKGIMDQYDEDHGGEPGYGDVIGKSTAVTIRTGSLPGLAAGGTVVVNSFIYKVREVRQLDDGALTRVTLAEET